MERKQSPKIMIDRYSKLEAEIMSLESEIIRETENGRSTDHLTQRYNRKVVELNELGEKLTNNDQ